MPLMTSSSPLVLWHDLIKHAEKSCSITLDEELEAYLVSLLIRYTDKPEVVRQIFATGFLEALDLQARQKNYSLQRIGDQCLLFAGLFPRAAQKKHVKISYFVDLGQCAYAAISQKTNDLYGSLALQFVLLMDVLQSTRSYQDLLPLEAYEQWNEVGSQRAFRILQQYSQGTPSKR